MRGGSMLLLLTLAVYGSASGSESRAALPRADSVDVPRFMGDWYVIAHIPTRPERNAYDAVESYALRPDGRIQTTFTYRKGSFQAPLKSMHPIGQVAKQGNGALWRMQFFWPFKAEYVIAWRDAEYARTIVARSKRDYVWYMARTPQVSDADYQQAVNALPQWATTSHSYDVCRSRRADAKAPMGNLHAVQSSSRPSASGVVRVHRKFPSIVQAAQGLGLGCQVVLECRNRLVRRRHGRIDRHIHGKRRIFRVMTAANFLLEAKHLHRELKRRFLAGEDD